MEMMEKADPIIGIRVALNPIVRRPDGKEELLGEIAAEVFDIEPQISFLRELELRWKVDRAGVLGVEYGPDFDFTPAKRA